LFGSPEGHIETTPDDGAAEARYYMLCGHTSGSFGHVTKRRRPGTIPYRLMTGTNASYSFL